MSIPRDTPGELHRKPLGGWSATVMAGLAVLGDSGDPVPFPPTEGRLADWLGLAVYSALVVAVCVVCFRMARSSSQDQEAGKGEVDPAPPLATPPVATPPVTAPHVD